MVFTQRIKRAQRFIATRTEHSSSICGFHAASKVYLGNAAATVYLGNAEYLGHAARTARAECAGSLDYLESP